MVRVTGSWCYLRTNMAKVPFPPFFDPPTQYIFEIWHLRYNFCYFLSYMCIHIRMSEAALNSMHPHQVVVVLPDGTGLATTPPDQPEQHSPTHRHRCRPTVTTTTIARCHTSESGAGNGSVLHSSQCSGKRHK